jgi:peptidoglycan/LPS O-acetylase OafA/YrhL
MRDLHFGRLRSSSDELLHLDLLRFVAAAGIVYSHSNEFFVPIAQRSSTDDPSSGLVFFVDLFFAISGYVISYVYSQKMASGADFVEFMKRRIGRLVPLHWLTLACSIVLWVLILKMGAKPNHTPSFEPKCIALTVALLHAGISCGGEIFNGASWSISAEMAMYVVFPLFCFIGLRWRPLPFILAVAIVLLLLVGVVARPITIDSWADMHPYLRALPSFLFGVGLWFCRGWLQRFPLAQPVLWVCLLALLVAMNTGASPLVVLLFMYLVIAAAAASDAQKKAGRWVTTFAPLGQLTYSIYMWHGLFIMVLMNAVGDKLLHGRIAFMIPLAVITYITVLAAGYFSYFYIETPARRWVDGLPIGQPRVTPQRKAS